MSKSTEDILRDLETSGLLEGKPAALPATRPEKPPRRSRGNVGSSGLVFLVVAAVLAAAIGSLPFGSLALYPFSLFVTLIHETGHALAASLTFGTAQNLRINPDLSGVVNTKGGLGPLIYSAGYLGATLAGVGLLLTPLRYARWALGALAVIPFLDLLFFHPYNRFTLIWAVIFLGALGVAAWKLPQRFAAFLQIFLGVQVGLNSFRDLMTLFFISGTNAHIHTDAVNMSNALFLPPIFWSLLWTVLAVVLLVAALVKVVRRDLPSLRRPRAGAL